MSRVHIREDDGLFSGKMESKTTALEIMYDIE